jgi:hypothetical protein
MKKRCGKNIGKVRKIMRYDKSNGTRMIFTRYLPGGLLATQHLLHLVRQLLLHILLEAPQQKRPQHLTVTICHLVAYFRTQQLPHTTTLSHGAFPQQAEDTLAEKRTSKLSDTLLTKRPQHLTKTNESSRDLIPNVHTVHFRNKEKARGEKKNEKTLRQTKQHNSSIVRPRLHRSTGAVRWQQQRLQTQANKTAKGTARQHGLAKTAKGQRGSTG